MPQAQLGHILNELNNQIDSSNNLVTTVKNLRIPNIQVEIIAEMAFLRIFIAWEIFLEESYIRFMVGAQSPSGYYPCRLLTFLNIEIARNTIRGERQEYAKWNSASDILARARIHFHGGGPYTTALNAMTTEFNEFNTIRNRIAHKSTYSRNQFNRLIRRIFGHSVRGMTPGRFLLTNNHLVAPSTTFLNYYTQIIQTASTIIVR